MQKGDRRKHFRYGLGGICLGDSVLGVGGEEVKEISAPSQLRYYKELVVHTKDIVQTNDVVVSPELPENIDFLLELGNVLWVVPEHDALAGKLFSLPASVGTQMPLGLSPGGNADLSIGTFSNDQISVQQIGGSPLGRLVGRRRLGSDRWRRKGGFVQCLLTVAALWGSKVLVWRDHGGWRSIRWSCLLLLRLLSRRGLLVVMLVVAAAASISRLLAATSAIPGSASSRRGMPRTAAPAWLAVFNEIAIVASIGSASPAFVGFRRRGRPIVGGASILALVLVVNVHGCS
mmetsp:Transcript_8249/g.20302  ORF Transcript_8249/g.20302 Transcript_8249/m.20302 type:complete len:289 (-) Transcript_8249:526-1392(-)